MTLWPSSTSWGWFRTSAADGADTRHADMFLATILTLRGTSKMLLCPDIIY